MYLRPFSVTTEAYITDKLTSICIGNGFALLQLNQSIFILRKKGIMMWGVGLIWGENLL